MEIGFCSILFDTVKEAKKIPEPKSMTKKKKKSWHLKNAKKNLGNCNC